MSDTSTHESITEAIPNQLGEYLVDAVEDLKEFYDEWPQANETLDMPCVSIITLNPEFRPLMPYYIKPTDPEIAAHKADVKYVVGIYDIPIQLDIWARNKEERDDLFDAVFNALNPTISPMGLVLGLEQYHNQLCDFVMTGHEHGDSAERSERDEWRTTLKLLATCKAVRIRKDFIIEETELTTQTYDTNEPME